MLNYDCGFGGGGGEAWIGAHLVDAWPVVGGVSSEGDVEQLEERVHAGDQRLVQCGAVRCMCGGAGVRRKGRRGKTCEKQRFRAGARVSEDVCVSGEQRNGAEREFQGRRGRGVEGPSI